MTSLIRTLALTPTLFAVFLPEPAYAYIGPGAGLGAIAVALALAAGLFLLIVGLVWYPLKRMIKGRKKGAAEHDERHNS